MTELQEFIAKLERLNVMEVAVETINETSKAFLDLNRDQLKHGWRATGKAIGTYKNTEYSKMKNQENSLAGMGRMDLILTHSMEEQMFIDVYPDKYLVGSSDEDKIDPKLLDGTFGLTDDHQKGYNLTVFLPLFLQKIQQITGVVPN